MTVSLVIGMWEGFYPHQALLVPVHTSSSSVESQFPESQKLPQPVLPSWWICPSGPVFGGHRRKLPFKVFLGGKAWYQAGLLLLLIATWGN